MKKIKQLGFRFKIWLLMMPSLPKLCMIFLLYCTAISFFIMGVQLFIEEQELRGTIQKKVAQASSETYSPRSVLYVQPEKKKRMLPKKQELQKGIAENVIRLHIKANSDSVEDQRLKISVRDEVLTGLQDALSDITSEKKAEEVIVSRLAEVKRTAEGVIAQKGYSCSVKVFLSDRMFPVKKYGDLTFPAGIYRALCIYIGKAEGHNWWCVLFPSLCFLDETTAVVPDESKEKLKDSLSEEEYELLEEPPEARSLILDWFMRPAEKEKQK